LGSRWLPPDEVRTAVNTDQFGSGKPANEHDSASLEEQSGEFLLQESETGDYNPYETAVDLSRRAPALFPCPGCKRVNRTRREIEQGLWCPDCKNPCLPAGDPEAT
jgi:hypothetical protein